ncbi:hypothetical protein, partial [Sphingomonas sp. CROZ-RG-20F-R02-07]|uniref:hypothetical protein n=1 Tax=Sphingomonas sp. CROZ-RG-20F-R02-07 TaxID=2914832 RepID=UPI001F5860E6
MIDKEGRLDWLLYGIGLDSIARAFRSTIKSFEAERSLIESDWAAHEKAVEAGEAETVVEEETTGAYFDYGEHIGELLYEVEESKRLVREAFVTVLYHHWEKKVAELLSLKRYDQKKAFVAAKLVGWKTDEGMIDKLRMVANCIKHDSTQSQTLNSLDKSYFDQAEIAHGWYDALRITDAHLEAFIEAVKSSGPPMKKWMGKPQEV